MNEFWIIRKDKKKIATILPNYPSVAKTILDESCVKGNFKKGSDFDLTLLGHHLTWNKFTQIAHNLENTSTFDLSIFQTL